MKNQVGSSRLDTVLKMLLIAFISLLAFSSGVYFGKQMSDSDYQLKALEADFNSATQTAKKSDDLDMKQDEAILDDEVDAIADKFVEVERKPASGHGEADTHQDAKQNADHEKVAAHGKTAEPAKAEVPKADAKVAAAHAAPAAHGNVTNQGHEATHPSAKTEIAKPDLSAVHKAASRVAHSQAPSEDVKKVATEPSRFPSNLPKTVGASADVEFTVQVASYPNATDAKSHASDLVKKGFPAFPVEATIDGKTWYRVSVGSFKTMVDATKYRATLIKDAGVQAAIVQKIQR